MESAGSSYAKLEEGQNAPVVAVPAEAVVVHAQPVTEDSDVQSYAAWGQQDIALLTLPGREMEENFCCAQVGCMLSWIPLVGFVTFLVNCDARPESKRRHFANMACWIASSVVIIQLIIVFSTGSA